MESIEDLRRGVGMFIAEACSDVADADVAADRLTKTTTAREDLLDQVVAKLPAVPPAAVENMIGPVVRLAEVTTDVKNAADELVEAGRAAQTGVVNVQVAVQAAGAAGDIYQPRHSAPAAAAGQNRTPWTHHAERAAREGTPEGGTQVRIADGSPHGTTHCTRCGYGDAMGNPIGTPGKSHCYYTRCGRCGRVHGPYPMWSSHCPFCGGGDDKLSDVPEGTPDGPPDPPDGEEPEKPTMTDALRLAKRIPLEDGQTLVGSSKVDGDNGGVRIAAVDDNGTRKVRIGAGGWAFGTRDDDAGPWTAGPDRTDEINRERAKLADEEEHLRDRMSEIEDAEAVAAANADSGRNDSVAELNAERDRINARLDEIGEEDTKVNKARYRKEAGEDVPESELNPPPYCEPGEYDRLNNRAKKLWDVPRPHLYPNGDPRPGQPGEWEAAEERLGKLDDVSTGEIHPAGYTAELDAAAAAELRDKVDYGTIRARKTFAENSEKFDRIDKLEEDLDKTTDADRRDAMVEELEKLKAETAAIDYEVFVEGSVKGDWGDVHYRVELDDYGIGPQVTIGVVPHGSDITVDDLHGYEQVADLTPKQADTLVKHLDRAIEGTAKVAALATAAQE